MAKIEPKEENHSMTDASELGQQKPKEEPKETQAQKIERLEREKEDLKQQKDDLETIVNSQPKISDADAKYMTDMTFFDKAKVGAGVIVVKDICDHKNISLWTPWGKRIGPMHPHNAKYCYHKFRKLGRILYTAKPSEAEIQAYYKTPEYKEWKKGHDAERERKNKSKSGKGLREVLDAMVKITGQNRADLLSIIEKPVNLGK